MTAAVKSPTTRPDPSGGIRAGLRKLDPVLLSRVVLASLATTFATNAIVEDVGAEAGLILIGYDGRPEVIPRSTRVFQLEGGHTVTGQEKVPLDLPALEKGLDDFVRGLEAVAVAGFFSVRNPDHELRAARLIRSRYDDLPLVRAHRLSMRLDAIKRATTAWWNARLIPLISRLIRACREVLIDFQVDAPLMVVRGDGTLMSADMALDRPVDTLLSGPAASILGAKHLAGVTHGLIVDMGGTTTDMAALVDNRVVVDPMGARVGRWETHVEAAQVRTIGLGGDSFIGWDGNHHCTVGPRRVVPLCVAAENRPEIKTILQIVRRKVQNAPHRGINPCSIYVKHRDEDSKETGDLFNDREDLISEYLIWADSREWRHALELDGLERKGRYFRCGLTPTDLRVAAGRFALGDAEAARLGLAVMAGCLGVDDERMTEMVEDHVRRRLCREAVSFVGGKGFDAVSELAGHWYPTSIPKNNGVGLEVRLSLTAPVIGVGAPAPACVPQSFEHLNAESILPQGYDVSVAVGAVVGMVDLTVRGTIRPDNAGNFSLYTAAGKAVFRDPEEAVKEGRRRMEAEAREQMRLNWVPDPVLAFRIGEKKSDLGSRG